MIVSLYGSATAPFAAPVADALRAAAARRGGEIRPLTIDEARASPVLRRNVRRVYVLPFDERSTVPAAAVVGERRDSPAVLLAELFPDAEVANPLAVHELCWDKPVTSRRLLERGVSVPETLITNAPEEAREFIRRHEQAILKEPRSCAGQGHLVVFADGSGCIAGESGEQRRYVVELEAAGRRRLAHGVLSVPPPFYLQRLVTEVRRDGSLRPAQILRAYVVDRQIVFWTERYRDRIRRPSDFIVNVATGARYRFLPAVSDAAHKTARRAAEVLGVRFGAVDLIRTGNEGPYVLEVDTDGPHMMLDRSFKDAPEFRDPYDLDEYIAEALLAEDPVPVRRRGAAGRSATAD